MGWLGKSEYNCPECDGECEVVCSECGAECDCNDCEGTGWDPGQVDIPAFKAAVNALDLKILDGPGCGAGTWEGIDQTDTRWGRDGGTNGRVVVTDYLL